MGKKRKIKDYDIQCNTSCKRLLRDSILEKKLRCMPHTLQQRFPEDSVGNLLLLLAHLGPPSIFMNFDHTTGRFSRPTPRQRTAATHLYIRWSNDPTSLSLSASSIASPPSYTYEIFNQERWETIQSGIPDEQFSSHTTTGSSTPGDKLCIYLRHEMRQRQTRF